MMPSSEFRTPAIRVAKGDVRVFLDDDATTTEDWLNALSEGYSRLAGRRSGCRAGQARLVREAAFLAIAADEVMDSRVDFGDQPRLLENSETPFGTIMSMGRQVMIVAACLPSNWVAREQV